MSEIVLVLGAAHQYETLLREPEATNVIGRPSFRHIGATARYSDMMTRLLQGALAVHGSDIIAYLLPPRLDSASFGKDIFKQVEWREATEKLPERIKELEVHECEQVVDGCEFYIGGLDQFNTYCDDYA